MRKSFAGWSMKTVQDLQKKPNSNIKSVEVQVIKPVQIEIGGRIVTKHFHKPKSQEKDFIAKNLLLWCNEHGFQLQEEFRFDTVRRYRFDWMVKKDGYGIGWAVEYEGGIINPNGDHRSIKGMTRDIDKYHLAQELGYKVLRFHAINYQNLITELNKLLNA